MSAMRLGWVKRFQTARRCGVDVARGSPRTKKPMMEKMRHLLDRKPIAHAERRV
jgi:hypothetical protein